MKHKLFIHQWTILIQNMNQAYNNTINQWSLAQDQPSNPDIGLIYYMNDKIDNIIYPHYIRKTLLDHSSDNIYIRPMGL